MTQHTPLDVHRERFVGWIADRFQERHSTPLDRATALADAQICLEEYEAMGEVKFGDRRYSWGQGAARDIADDEIETGWEFEP